MPLHVPLQVKEIGSFHLGGHTTTLTGLPPRSMVLTKGAAPRTFPTDGDDPERLLQAADSRLYAMKKQLYGSRDLR